MSRKNGEATITLTATPSKKKRDPEERIRLLATREEVIEVKLTQVEIEDKRMEVMTLLDDEERIEEKAKEAAKNFQGQLKTNQLQRNELRRAIAAGRVRQTLTVEEYLTGSNEVVRIRMDTGEKIGQRTATSRELQEDLPLEPPSPGSAPQNDAQPSGEAPLPDMGSAFGAEPQ